MRLLNRKTAWLTLVLCMALLLTAADVVKAGPPDGPDLIEGETMLTLPEGMEIPAEMMRSIRPSETQGESVGPMTWTTLFTEDFEGAFPGTSWLHASTSSYWGPTTYRSYSVNHSAFNGASGTDAYDPRESYYVENSMSWMLSNGYFDFSTVSDAYLDLKVWMDTEVYSDSFQICASNDGAAFWCHIWTGSTMGWNSMSFTFSDWPHYGSLIGDPQVWIAFIFSANEIYNYQGVFIDDIVVRSTASSTLPDTTPITYLPPRQLYHPGDLVSSITEFYNVGSANCTYVTVDEYLSTDAVVTSGDILVSTTSYATVVYPGQQWYTVTNGTIPDTTAAGMYYMGVIYTCSDDYNQTNDVMVYPNMVEVTDPGVGGMIFSDGFELADLTAWSNFNPGKTGLAANNEAGMAGNYGAYFYRPPGNDKRRQLIDQTPNEETVFLARFDFDVNSLSMGVGEPLRIMQFKNGAERPVFLVMRYYGGEYQIQLNVKEDDLTKTKTAWIPLSDEPHTIEVDWAASSTAGANDGHAELYIDDVLQESLTGLDIDTLTILSFRLGYTSRLAGKSISGAFYVDEVWTSNGVHLAP